MPEDAKEAIGHGVRAKRSKAGVSFDVLCGQIRAIQKAGRYVPAGHCWALNACGVATGRAGGHSQ
jgi:hypothetical protein